VLNYHTDYKKTGESFFLKKVLSDNVPCTIVDVGANVGDYSLIASKINNSAIIHAIEPMPNSYKLLTNNVMERRQIYPHNFAMSEKKGVFTMYDFDDENSQLASSYKEAITELRKIPNVKEFSVNVTTLDEFCAENKIENIRLLKIDTEGQEYAILMGAKKMLEDKCIEIIHLEFNDINVLSRVFFRDFFHLLHNDFKIYRLLTNGVLPIKEYIPVMHEIFAYQNIIAVKNEIKLFEV